MSEDKGLLKVQLQKVLPGKKRDILRLLADVESLAQFVSVVREGKLVEKKEAEVITSWRVEVDGLPIRWTQKSRYDHVQNRIFFEAIEGDLQAFKGEWGIYPADDGASLLTLKLEARLGIPMFEEVVQLELQASLQKIFYTLLEAFEEKLLDERYPKDLTKMTSKPRNFAVMGHPYNFNHLFKMFQVLRPNMEGLSQDFLLKIFEMAPSYKGSDIKGFKSHTGATIDGYFVMCPIIPDMAVLTPDIVLPKVLEGCRIAERLDAGVLALGGFTSIVGERFLQVLKSKVKMPITTGNAFTVAMTLAGVRKAAKLMGVKLSDSTVTVIGGTGDIGSACARVLSKEAKQLIVTGRTLTTMGKLKDELVKMNGPKIEVSTDNNQAVKGADIVIAAASSTEPIVEMDNIKSGAIVCDVGYPKNISYHSKSRDDILVFSGGLCELPSEFPIMFDVGLPSPKILYGCWAESIILCLEKRFENFSEGKGLITVENVDWIQQAADKHGFKVAPFYWGSRMLDDRAIEAIQHKVKSA